MPKLYLDKNTYTILPPLSDWLEDYMKERLACGAWQSSNQKTIRMALRRFDHWLKLTGLSPQQITWIDLHKLHDFVKDDGISNHGSRRVIQSAKMALRWAIENKAFPQKITDIYPANVFRKHKWTHDLLPEMEEFLDELTAGHSSKTATIHRLQLRMFNTFLQNNKITSAKKIRRETIVKFMQFVKTTSLNNQTRFLLATKSRIFIKWLCARQILNGNPDDVFPRSLIPKQPLHHPRPIDLDIDLKIIDYCRNSNDFYMKAILFMRLTGVRFSELAALPKNCISCDSEGRYSMLVPPIKNGKEHFVPLSDETRSLIGYFTNIAATVTDASLNNSLVVRPTGGLLLHRELHQEFHALLSHLKIKKWLTPHALRHTFATSMLNAGMSLQSLQHILGHKTIVMTLKYAKLSQNRIKEEFAKAVDYIKSHHSEAIQIDEPSVDSQILRLISIVKAKVPNSRNRLAALKALSRVKSLCRIHS